MKWIYKMEEECGLKEHIEHSNSQQSRTSIIFIYYGHLVIANFLGITVSPPVNDGKWWT